MKKILIVIAALVVTSGNVSIAQTCDYFTAPNSTVVPGWTEMVGDWSIFNNTLRSPGSMVWNYVMVNGSSQANGCITARATYGGVTQVKYLGLVGRYASPSSYIMAKIQDNGNVGYWNSYFIYSNSVLIQYINTGVNYGSDANIQMEYNGATVTFRIDQDRNGTWDYAYTTSVGNTASGLTGAGAYAQGNMDDYCYGVSCCLLPTVGAITGPLSVCAGQSYTYSIAPVAGATSYNWTVPAGAVITSGAGTTSITVTFGANGGQICVTADNSCGTSAPVCITVVLTSAPPTPGPITGTAVICPGQTFTYSISAVAGATSYSWTVPSGATINSGQGTTSISVTFGANAGQICVTASNTCGASAASCLSISLGSPPATPGPITGTDTICPGQTFTYSIPAVPGAISYTWSVPSGSSISSGQGTTSIDVTFGFSGGQICVTATNACGTSPAGCYTIVIGGAPVAPAAITGPANVCAGTVQTYSIIAVPGAASYNWTVPPGTVINSGQGSTSINVTIGLTAGQICVTAIGPCGTSPATCITLVITSIPPTPGMITGPISVCDGSSQTYSVAAVPGANSYTWTVPPGATINSGQGSTSINVTFGSGGGNVCVTATNGCGTSPPSCLTVTVNPIPTVTNSPLSQTVCSGQATTAVTLTSGVPGTSFTWTATATAGLTGYSPNGTNTIPSMVITNPGATAGTLTITITPAANGCFGPSVVYTITVLPVPAITNSPLTQTICSGQSTTAVTLTSNVSGATFGWTASTSGSITGFSPSGTGNIPAMTLTNSGGSSGTLTFTITPTAGGCSGNPVNYVITVNPTPDVSNSPMTQTICSGQSITAVILTSNVAGTSFSWTATATGGITGYSATGTATIPVQTLNNPGFTAGTVTYTITPSANGCTGTAVNFVVTVNPLPTIVITPSGPFCINSAATNLSATPVGGTWSGTGITDPLSGTFDPATAMAGVHTITYNYTDPNTGCSNSGTQNFTVNALPAVSFSALANVCLNSPPFTLSGGNPAGGVYSGTGVSGSSFNPALAGVGTTVITYTYTNPATGCTNSATQSISVISGIVVSVTPTDTWVCSGASAALSGSGATTYSWSPPTGLSSTSGTIVLASPDASTIYTVTGTDASGCSGTASVTVNVYPQNGLVFSAMPIEGCKPLEVNFVFTPGSLIQDSTWYWDFGDVFSGINNSYDVAPTHTFDNEGQYTVTLAAITTDGCIETGTYEINVYNRPFAEFEPHPAIADMSNPTITFGDQSSGANYWYWNFDDGGSGNSNYSFEQFPEHTFSDTGTYNVIMVVESEHGCSDTVSKPVLILPEVLVFSPTAFTPDGDGLNDIFSPSIDGIQPQNFEMFIYDRWGQLIYETKDLRKGWDGAVNGKIESAPSGSYTWIAYYTSAQNKKFRILGRVILIK